MDLFENRRKGQTELSSSRLRKREWAATAVFTRKIGGSSADFTGLVKKFPYPAGISGRPGQNLAFHPGKWSCRSENMVNAEEIAPIGPEIEVSYLE